MIKLCHIAPINYSELAVHESDANLVLAHIAEKSDSYCELFKNSAKETILDNGAFELGVPYGLDKMVTIGDKVGADILVLPDYPGHDWNKGWYSLEDDIQAYKDKGFKTMFVPQSVTGDGVGYMKSLRLALAHPDIDLIGLSILGCPNAFPQMPSHKVRAMILESVNGLEEAEGRFHILGMLDSVNEIASVSYYDSLINSWDTSAAMWYAIKGKTVEHNNKCSVPAVDFNYPVEDFSPSLFLDNVNYMKGLR